MIKKLLINWLITLPPFKCKCFYIDNISAIISNLHSSKYEFKHIHLILTFIKITVLKTAIYSFRNNYGTLSSN